MRLIAALRRAAIVAAVNLGAAERAVDVDEATT